MNVHSIRLLAAAAAGGALLWLASAFGGSPDEPAWREMNAEVAAWLDGSSAPETAVEEEEANLSENVPPQAPLSAVAGPAAEVEAAGGEAAPADAPAAAAGEAAPAAAPAAVDGLVDINRATVEALDALPGIGPAKAKAIVEYREANGPFATAEAIMNVKGIGPAVFGKIEASITVGRTPPSDANADDGK